MVCLIMPFQYRAWLWVQVPPSIAKEALGWFMGSRQAAGNSRRKE